jgi:hypothetical protein
MIISDMYMIQTLKMLVKVSSCLKFVIIFTLLIIFFVGLQIQRLGRVDSDFAPFVQYAGVPSVDIYYGKGTCLVNMN